MPEPSAEVCSYLLAVTNVNSKQLKEIGEQPNHLRKQISDGARSTLAITGVTANRFHGLLAIAI